MKLYSQKDFSPYIHWQPKHFNFTEAKLFFSSKAKANNAKNKAARRQMPIIQDLRKQLKNKTISDDRLIHILGDSLFQNAQTSIEKINNYSLEELRQLILNLASNSYAEVKNNSATQYFSETGKFIKDLNEIKIKANQLGYGWLLDPDQSLPQGFYDEGNNLAKIQDQLTKLLNKNHDGIKPSTLIGHLNNLFGGGLFEVLGAIQVYNNINENIEKLQSSFNINTPNLKVRTTGTSRVQSTTSKADFVIGEPGALSITVKTPKNGLVTLTGEVGVSVKATTAKNNRVISAVTGTPFNSKTIKDIFGDNGKYWVYNTIADLSLEDDAQLAYQTMKTTMISKQAEFYIGGKDRALFLLVNNEYYSIPELIDKAIAESTGGGSFNKTSDFFYLNLQGAGTVASANAAYSRTTTPNWQIAYNRHQKLYNLLNKIKINAKLQIDKF